MAAIIRLGKKDDIVSVIRKIKDLKEKEVIFELEKGSQLLSSSANLKLIKRTGETLGKKVMVTTQDQLGRLLALKAGVLADQTDEDVKKIAPKTAGVKRTIKPGLGEMRGLKPSIAAQIPKVPKLGLSSKLASKYLPTKGKPAASTRSGKVMKMAVIAAIFILLSGVAGAVFLPRADITVFARSEPITRDLDLRVDKNASQINVSNLSVPGVTINREISQTKTFPVTGTKLSGTKARGSVIFVNGTGSTLRLRAETTTLTANGKNYTLVADATDIRTGNEQTNSGNPVQIVAAEAGDSYHLPSQARMEVVNSALGNRSDVYALVSSPVTGGSAVASLALNQDDLDMALSKSTQELLATAETELQQENPGYKLIASGTKTEILAQTANKNIGDEVESFDYTVIARFTGLAFNPEDVKNLLHQQVEQVLSSDKYLVSGAREKVETLFKSVDLEQGLGALAVHFETLVAFKIETATLPRILEGKTSSEIKEILLSKPEIDRVDVRFSPFFVKRAPSINNKVYINTALSQL